GYLSAQCATEEKIAPFFVQSHAALGSAFWAERWHRGLAACRTPDVRAVLSEAIAASTTGARTAVERAQFFSVLSVYARNLREEAVPRLTELATTLEDPEEVTFVISAFGDAAGVGSPEGVSASAVEAVTDALKSLGPNLPAKAVEQGRAILVAIGDQHAADHYVRYRWPAAWRNGEGSYAYAVVALERSTCDNGKLAALAH